MFRSSKNVCQRLAVAFAHFWRIREGLASFSYYCCNTCSKFLETITSNISKNQWKNMEEPIL